MLFDQTDDFFSQLQFQDGVEVARLTSDPARCSYLPEQTSELEYRYVIGMQARSYQRYLERGWRRFGNAYFRPVCAKCSRCRPIRIDVAQFKSSKSQRRTRKKNEDVQLEIVRPALNVETLKLYDKYHADMARRRDWPVTQADPDEFHESLVAGANDFGYEFRYRIKNKLVAVGFVDILPDAFSSVYFFYDPELRSRSLGVYSVLREIEEAKRTGRAHLYLGYYIRDNQSMNYKNKYKPHQFLQDFVEQDELPVWHSEEVENSFEV